MTDISIPALVSQESSRSVQHMDMGYLQVDAPVTRP